MSSIDDRKSNQFHKASCELEKLIFQLKQERKNVLPTELELAEKFHVSRNTVRRAVGELEKEGVVQRIRGKGTFIHNESVHISFANWVSAEFDAERFLDRLRGDFQKHHGSLKIKNLVIPYRAYLQSIFNLALQGEFPDVVQITPFWLRRLQQFNLFLPLGKYISHSIVKRRYAKAIQLGRIGEEIFALNWTLCPLVLYYNKAVMEKAGLDPDLPPRTLEELAEMSIRVNESKHDNLYGICLPLDSFEINFMIICTFFLSFRGGFTDPIGNIVIDSAENIRALTWLKEMYQRGGVKKENSIDGTRLLFAADQLAFMIDGPYGRGNIRQLSGLGAGFDSRYGVTAVPIGPSGKSENILLSHALAISRHSRNPNRAYQWIEYLSTNEQNARFYFKEFGMIPCNRDVLHKPFFFSDPFASVLIRQIETATVDPIEHPLFFRILPFLQHAIAEVILHDADPASSLAFVRRTIPIIKQAHALAFL